MSAKNIPINNECHRLVQQYIDQLLDAEDALAEGNAGEAGKILRDIRLNMIFIAGVKHTSPNYSLFFIDELEGTKH